MSAIEYVKKNGIEKSKIHLDKMKQERWINSFFNDLKQIVDAWELVEKHGGLDNAKYDAKYLFSNWDYSSPMELRIKQAINRVEQCQ